MRNNAAERFRKGFYNLRRHLKLTPIHAVMHELLRRGVDLHRMHALDLFGGKGDMITRDWAPYVQAIDVWEIETAFESELRHNLPGAHITICDSYAQIERCQTVYDLIVADTWTRPFDGHHEHFELFPSVFRLMNPSFSILILNVMPWLTARKTSHVHLDKRREFYETRDPILVPLTEMVKVYGKIADESGVRILWWFYKDRYFLFPMRKTRLGKRLGFLVLALQGKEPVGM